jgi:hypothetical protein
MAKLSITAEAVWPPLGYLSQMVNQVAFTKHRFSDWDGALTELWPHELNQVAAICRIRDSRKPHVGGEAGLVASLLLRGRRGSGGLQYDGEFRVGGFE